MQTKKYGGYRRRGNKIIERDGPFHKGRFQKNEFVNINGIKGIVGAITDIGVQLNHRDREGHPIHIAFINYDQIETVERAHIKNNPQSGLASGSHRTKRRYKKKKKSRRKRHKRHRGRKSRRKRAKARGLLTSPLRTYRIWKRHYQNKKKRATLRRKRNREARERRERELLAAPSIASTPSSAASIPTFYSQTSTPISITPPSQSTPSSFYSDRSTPEGPLPLEVGPKLQQGGRGVGEKDLQENKQDKEHKEEKKGWFDLDFGKGLFGTWFTDPPKNKHGIWSSDGMTCRPWLPLQCPGGGKCVGTGLGIGNFSFKGKCMSS